jgi:hypothetical protein
VYGDIREPLAELGKALRLETVEEASIRFHLSIAPIRCIFHDLGWGAMVVVDPARGNDGPATIVRSWPADLAPFVTHWNAPGRVRLPIPGRVNLVQQGRSQDEEWSQGCVTGTFCCGRGSVTMALKTGRKSLLGNGF